MCGSLVAALLLERSFASLLRVDGGYTAENVLVADVFSPNGDHPDQGDAMQRLVASLVARARALPL